MIMPTPFRLLLICLFLVLAGCTIFQPGPTPPPTPPAQPTLPPPPLVLEIAYWQAPTMLNPHLSASAKDLGASRITYEPLATFNDQGELIPFLAAEIPTLGNGGVAADGLSVTWNLRRDVQWADGQPFTADDVLFTFEFVTNPEVQSASAGVYSGVEQVEVVDDYTVRLHFKTVNPAWNVPFVGIRGMIIPRHVFQDYLGANAREAPANLLPVGTGPFYATENEPQEVLFLGDNMVQTYRIVFERNPYFREAGKPYLDRVILRAGGLPAEAARLVLEVGEADFAWNLTLPPEQLNQMESTGGQGQLVVSFGARVDRLLLNRTDPNRVTTDGERSNLQFLHPFFNDLRVRQAISLAIDRERVAALYGVTGRVASNNLVVPPQYASSNTSFRYDPAGANTLLDETGWLDHNGDGFRDKDGTTMKIVYQTSLDALLQQTQAIIKENLEAVGIEVELRPVEASVFFSRNSPDSVFYFAADIQEFFIGMVNPDPGAYMVYWTCAQIPQQLNSWSAGLNIERYCNPDYDALYQQSSIELDPQRRQQLFIQMNDMLINDVVMIPLVHLAEVSAVSNQVTGIAPTPWDSVLWNIKDWQKHDDRQN